MVSTLGLLNGLTSIGIIFIGTFFGILCLYEAKKYHIKLSAVAGLMCISIGSFWLGPTTDFFSILITGKNLKPLYIYSLLSYTCIPLGIIPAAMLFGVLIIGADMMQRAVAIPASIIMAIQGLISLAIVGSQVFFTHADMKEKLLSVFARRKKE